MERKAVNIEWDVETKEELENLPKEIMIPDGLKDDKISDYISDVTGYCHKGFEVLKAYSIPVTWEVWDKVTIFAPSLRKAIEYAKNNIDEIPLGTEPEYIDGSYKLDDGENGEASIEETMKYLKGYWNLNGELNEEFD